jgi:hypothetical protein
MSDEPGADEQYCSSCGEVIKKKAEICPNCGVRQQGAGVNRGSRSGIDVGNSIRQGFDRLTETTGILLVAVFSVIGLISTVAAQSQAARVFDQFGFFEQAPSEFERTLVENFAGGGPLAFDIPSSLISLMNLGSSVAYLVAAIVAYRVFASNARDEIPSETYSGLLMPTINGIIAGIVFVVLIAIGLILLIIPGIYLAVALYFFLIFISLEDESFIDALQSSWELTKGRRLSVFLFFVGLVLVQILFSIVGGVASLALGAAVPILGAVVNVAVGAAFTVFSLAALYDAYTQLRGSGGPASGAGVGTGEPPVGQGDTRTR